MIVRIQSPSKGLDISNRFAADFVVVVGVALVVDVVSVLNE